MFACEASIRDSSLFMCTIAAGRDRSEGKPLDRPELDVSEQASTCTVVVICTWRLLPALTVMITVSMWKQPLKGH